MATVEYVPLKLRGNGAYPAQVGLWLPRSPKMVSHLADPQVQSLESSDMATDTSEGTLPKQLPASFLEEITHGFSAHQKLGQGAFGTVYYKGLLQATEEQFKHEVGTLMAMKRELYDHCYEKKKKVVEHNGRYILVDMIEGEVGYHMAMHHELYDHCYEVKKKVVEHNGRYILVDVIESKLCYEYARSRAGGTIRGHIHGGDGTHSTAQGGSLRVDINALLEALVPDMSHNGAGQGNTDDPGVTREIKISVVQSDDSLDKDKYTKPLLIVLSISGSASFSAVPVIEKALGEFAPHAYSCLCVLLMLLAVGSFVTVKFDKAPWCKVFGKYLLLLSLAILVLIPTWVLISMILAA